MSAARAPPAPLLRARRVLLPLLLLAAAGAGATDDDCGQERRPTIAASKKRNIYGDLLVSYKEAITLYCSSTDASNLTIWSRNNGHQLDAEQLNSTTIQVRRDEPEDLYRYICTDGNTGCSDYLLVYVQPAMSVTGPRVHHTVDKYKDYIYFTKKNEAFNVSCTGKNAGSLVLYWGRDRRHIQATTVNATTITATMADDIQRGTYTFGCSGALVGWHITVIVDDYPDVQQFRCVNQYNREYEKCKLQCSWRTSSETNTFKLFLLDSKSGETALVCVDTSSAAGLVRGCGGELDHEKMKFISDDSTFSFQLQICNAVFCIDETFIINVYSIVKLEPVSHIKVMNISSRGATVAWRQYGWPPDIVYRVEYRLLGTDWRPVNASAVRCEPEYVSGSYVDVCELPVALPCPDAHYELRVYIRHVKATGDLYWSDPAHVYFFTTASAGDDAPDPACAADADYRHRPQPVTAESAFNEVQEVISKAQKRKTTIDKLVKTLHQKKAMVIKLMKNRT